MVLLITPGERQALRLMAGGGGMRDIASDLGMSEQAAHAHLHGLFERMGVSSRAEAIGVARRRGLLGGELDALDQLDEDVA
jgi:DNA-binding NarL/FixJ family response regulator